MSSSWSSESRIMGRKKPTLSIFLNSISIIPRAMVDFPLLASVAVIYRLLDMVPSWWNRVTHCFLAGVQGFKVHSGTFCEEKSV
jgi:hypothetical protein